MINGIILLMLYNIIKYDIYNYIFIKFNFFQLIKNDIKIKDSSI